MKRRAARSVAALCILAACLLCTAGAWHWRNAALASRLVAAWPAEALRDPALHAFASEQAPRLFRGRCAGCHGDALQGRADTGAPSLTGAGWLYGDGSIEDIEQTLLYGIRSGHPKARNVTDMPAIGRSHQLSPAQIDDVVEYLLKLNGHDHDDGAAERGKQVYFGAGNCYDCHSGDARGNPDYGAPSLVGTRWPGGGQRASLRRDIVDGRHGLCPAWLPVLGAAGVRTLAIYVHDASHAMPGHAEVEP